VRQLGVEGGIREHLSNGSYSINSLLPQGKILFAVMVTEQDGG